MRHEGTVQVFHLGKKEFWDAEDYVLMELGAKYALGGELIELFTNGHPSNLVQDNFL